MNYDHIQQPFYPSMYSGNEVVDELGFLPNPFELVGNVLGGVQNMVGGLLGGGGPGGLLGNLFGGGQKPTERTTPNTNPTVMALPPQGGSVLNQAVGQAMGTGPASNPLASLLGAGLGGVFPGTGPLPGPLGNIAQMLFGQRGLPPAPAAVRMAEPPQVAQLQKHTEQAGRAIVRRITGATEPELAKMRDLMELGQRQFQATAEHRNLAKEDRFRRQAIGHLLEIRNRIGGPSGAVIRPRSMPRPVPGFVF